LKYKNFDINNELKRAKKTTPLCTFKLDSTNEIKRNNIPKAKLIIHLVLTDMNIKKIKIDTIEISPSIPLEIIV
jgi:hypothetical protein